MTRVAIKNLSIRSNSMTLIYHQTKSEETLSKDVRGDAFLAEADVLHILGFSLNNSSSVVAMNFHTFGIPLKRLFQKCTLLPSLIYGSQVMAKYTGCSKKVLLFDQL